MSNATIALMVAIGSASVSLTGLAWQFMHYRLSGPRLSVRLIPVAFTQRGTVTGPDQGWGTGAVPTGRWTRDDLFCDLAEIRVVNIGRTATSVRDIQYDFGPSRWWRPWSRHGMALRSLEIDEDSIASSRVRLKPGESASVHMPVWPAIDYLRRETPASVSIRATATAAGRRRPARSRWRCRWTISAGTSQLFPAIEDSPSTRLFQMLVHSWPRADVSDLYDTWISVANALGHDSGNLTEILDDLGLQLGERLKLQADLTAESAALRAEREQPSGTGAAQPEHSSNLDRSGSDSNAERAGG